jgi:cholesterol transport system auxiliary component
MVYRPESYKVASYSYHKWRASPGDMVSDYLARDFQNSGLFRAVFSYHQPEAARFVVNGTVEEFAETRENGTWKARLSLRVTLLDMSRAALTEQVVIQKEYRVSEAMGGESPEAFAAGMSAAMSEVSAEIIADVNSAIGRQLTKEGS